MAARSGRSDHPLRAAEFMGKPIIEVLVWMRVPGDTIFSVGARLLAWFVARQWVLVRTAPLPARAVPEPSTG